MSEREDRSRLSEIMQILRRYRITKGITPVKVREILEELCKAGTNSFNTNRFNFI